MLAVSNISILEKDRNYFGPGAVDQFDALVIDVRFFLNAKETLEMIPKKRQPFQRYVFHTHEVRAVQVSKQLETPVHTSADLLLLIGTWRHLCGLYASMVVVVVWRSFPSYLFAFIPITCITRNTYTKGD